MKFELKPKADYTDSRPRKGAWIEISPLHGIIIHSLCRPRKGAWIEIFSSIGGLPPFQSPPQGGVD